MAGRPMKRAIEDLLAREAAKRKEKQPYSKAMCKLAREHFSELRRNESDRVIGVPSIKSFAELVSQPIAEVLRWEREHPEFAEAMEECRELGKAVIIDAALVGLVNPKVAQFVLSAEYGMAEKHEQTVNGGVPAALSEEDRELLRKIGGADGESEEK